MKIKFIFDRRFEAGMSSPRWGWHPDFKAMLKVSTGGRCWYCGGALPENPSDWHVDHILSRAMGGVDNPENLVPCCAHCNLTKGTKTLEEFRQLVRSRQVPWPQRFKISSPQITLLESMGIVLPLPPPQPFWFEIHQWLESR